METYDTPRRGNRKKSNVPIMSTWLGHDMLSEHSLMGVVRDLQRHQIRNNFTSLSVIGMIDSGKSTITRVLVHLLHQEMQKAAHSKKIPLEDRTKIAMPYGIYWLTADDLLDLENTLLKLPPRAPRILVFDDTSFAGTRDQERKMANAMARVRHISSDGGDVKTVCVLIYHYSRSLNKFARDTSFRILTSLGAEERKSITDLLGHADRIRGFERHYQRLNKKEKVEYVTARSRTGRPTHTYTMHYGRPWRLALYHDGTDVRETVFPRDDAVVPRTCTICHADAPPDNTAKVMEALVDHCGDNAVGSALRLAAYAAYGEITLPRGYKARQAIGAIERVLGTGRTRLLDLLAAYDAMDHKSPTANKFDATSWKDRRTYEMPEALRNALWQAAGVDLGCPPSEMTAQGVADRTLIKTAATADVRTVARAPALPEPG